MSSQAFDAQLLVPDNNDSHLELVELITAGRFTGPGLPDVAHRYLDAFCNKSYSNGRRRWAGIALAGMMRASSNVVQRLKKLSQGLSRVGAIILDQEESEERRIIAGLIVRQGLEVGIDFADFWKSDKVLHSAPNFPKDSSEQWMGQFQTYLDTLGNLALANLNNDPLILFPMSLSANDGYQWTGKSAVAIIEKNVLTIVMTDSTLTKVHFIDITIRYIRNTSLQQDSPHESQEGRSGYKMHSLIMTLRYQSPAYRLNSSDGTASEFKVSFLRSEDADEFDVGVEDARKNLASTTTATAEVSEPTSSSNPPEDFRKSSTLHGDASVVAEYEDHASCGLGSREVDVKGGPLDRLSEGKTSSQRVSQDKGKGKLPRISYAMKQKVTQPKGLPPSRSRVTKSRLSTKANPIVYEDEDEDENEESSEDEYDLRAKVPAHISTGPNKGRKSQRRRKASIEDDDDFVPVAKSKTKTRTTKRKRGSSDAGDDSRPKKKTQTKPSDASRAIAASMTAKKQTEKVEESIPTNSIRAREPMKQSIAQQNLQSGASSRPSLIGGLIKSNSSSKVAAPAFKRPGQPASTPGRPRAQPVRPSPKPQTPVETRTGTNDLPTLISSTRSSTPRSTPRSQAIHDEDFGYHHTPTDAEILSSNTKKVPDSPHAESTAISGHADRDDVHREKRMGDIETAKSDPFKQRRQGQKVTSLMRRFTDESATNEKPDSRCGEPLSMPAELANEEFEADELKVNFTSQPLLKDSPSLFKHRLKLLDQPRMQSSIAPVKEFQSLPAISIEARRAPTATSREVTQSLTFETACASQHTSYLAAKEATHAAATQRAQAKESIVSAPREVINDALPDPPAQHEVEADPDGETTLVEKDLDLPEQYGMKASDLRFRSSPPIPDSSSVRNSSSDVSEEEPEPSPATSRADELEWEAALQPHQRALHDQLLRTSKRVTRHIVDNETAVTDITDVFAKDGEHLLDLLLEKQGKESAEAFQNLANKRQELLKELSDASKSLKAQRRQARSVE